MFKAWLLAARPKTLSAAVVPVVATTALAYEFGYEIDGLIFCCALLASLSIQIATNFFNDAIDYAKGADTKNRIGPTRVTQAGLLSPKHVYGIGIFFCLLALLFGSYLVYVGGTPIVYIGIASLVFAFLYTGGPFPLAYYGLGDLFVLVFFGWVACLGMFYLYSGLWSFDAFILGTQIGSLSTVLIAINNLRDVDSDRAVKKRTLAVILGKTFVRIEIAFLYLLAFGLLFYWYSKSFKWASYYPLLLLPFAHKTWRFIHRHEPSPKYNEYLAKASGIFLAFAILFILGLLWPLE